MEEPSGSHPYLPQLGGVPSAESSYEDVAPLPMSGAGGPGSDEENEADVAELFGDFDAEGDAEGPADDGLPVPILDPSVIDQTCASGGAAAVKLVRFFEYLGASSLHGQHRGLATVAVRHATSGELLVAVPGAFKPKPNLPVASTGVVPRASVAAVGLDGRLAGRAKVPVAFIVWNGPLLENRSVFHWEDVQECVDQGDMMFFLDRPDVWPDCGDLLVNAESLGFGETRADVRASAASEAEGTGAKKGKAPPRVPAPKKSALEPRVDAIKGRRPSPCDVF